MELIEKHASFGGWQNVYRHYSQSLKCEMNVGVYLPPKAANEKLPVLYWLSGLTCNEQNFITKSGMQRYAAEHNIIVVAPDTSPRGSHVADADRYDLGQGAGFYLNATQAPWNEHYKMYDYIRNELPDLVMHHFPATAKKSISGHSMGGLGALETLVEAGPFRSDLYYRLNVIRIQAPTLRERKEDLPLLVDNFIHRLNYQLGMVIEGVAPGAMDLLMDYDWPGNVRELQNAVESAMNAADSPILRRRDFRQLEQRMQARRRRQLTGPGDFKLRPARQAFERELIRDALAAAGGNRVKAAALLDISRTVLYEKMEQYQLK